MTTKSQIWDPMAPIMLSLKSFDGIAREQETIGNISAESKMSNHELETARIGS